MNKAYLQRNYEEALEELDQENDEKERLKEKFKDAQDYITMLKDQIDVSKNKRKELVRRSRNHIQLQNSRKKIKH